MTNVAEEVPWNKKMRERLEACEDSESLYGLAEELIDTLEKDKRLVERYQRVTQKILDLGCSLPADHPAHFLCERLEALVALDLLRPNDGTHQPENLNTLRDDALAIANAHGFVSATVGEDLALMHSELSEALESFREGHAPAEFAYLDKKSGKTTPVFSPEFKPVGIPSEMADVVIRVMHFCGKHGIDIERAVREKMSYNKSRPFKHGKTL
jgi:NTP pyrophosphatase (non-canonical NTP hydrolase)